MNDNDFIKLWLMGVIALTGFVILLAIIFYKANTIVNAAYKTSDYVMKVME